MIESSEKKKSIFYLIVLLLTLIVMIIGATLAYFKLMASQKEEGTVLYTGTLQINYIDGIYLKDPILYPVKNVTFNTYENVYRNNFAISSTGTLNQIIAIDLVISKNEFVKNSLKYALYNNQGHLLASDYVQESGTQNILNNTYLAHGDTTNYTLIIWLEDINNNQNINMGSIISGRLDVHAIQAKY